MNLQKNETSNDNRNRPILYKNGQNHEMFIFVYSKLLLNSPFNEFPLIYRPK